MPQVRFTPAALRDLERLREFLRLKNPAAAKRAALAMTKAIKILEQHPQIGRPSEELDREFLGEHNPEGNKHRELLIDFGDSGYVALYRYENDLVTVLALRHQKEVG